MPTISRFPVASLLVLLVLPFLITTVSISIALTSELPPRFFFWPSNLAQVANFTVWRVFPTPRVEAFQLLCFSSLLHVSLVLVLKQLFVPVFKFLL